MICNFSLADQFIFETSKIEILNEGKLILAGEGKAKSIDNDLIIDAEKFEYNKDLGIIKGFNGVAYFQSNNLRIEFGEISSNQFTQFTSAKKKCKNFWFK